MTQTNKPHEIEGHNGIELKQSAWELYQENQKLKSSQKELILKAIEMARIGGEIYQDGVYVGTKDKYTPDQILKELTEK